MPYIHSLSDDILLEIFVYVITDDTQTAPFTPTQYILGTVCRRWRALILCSPLLWTDIRLPLKGPYHDCTLFERSSPALIHVTFSTEGFPSWDRTLRLNHTYDISVAISRNLARLRRFTIVFDEVYFGIDSMFAWPPREALNFKQLDITFTGIVPNYYGPLDNLDLDGNFLNHIESLRSVRLAAVQFSPHPILPNLTTLEMDQMAPGFQTLRKLFNHSPALETLVIGQFLTSTSFLDPSILSEVRVEAPSLRSLAINLNDHCHTNCGCELPYLTAKNLEYLEISYRGWSFTEHLSSILSRVKHFNRLRKLRIRNSVFLEEDTAFLATVPESTHLELVGFPSCMHPDVGLSILSLTSVQSIVIDLTTSSSTVLRGLKDGIMSLFSGRSTSYCPIIVCCEPDDPEFAFWQSFVGGHLSLQSELLPPGLLDEYLDAYDTLSDVPSIGPLFDGSLDDQQCS